MIIIKKTFTIETRIILNDNIKNYLNTFVVDYNHLYRIMWHQVNDPLFEIKYPKASYYITYICNTYNVFKRTANTIYRSIMGKQKALLELKRYEANILYNKINTIESSINDLKNKINKLKPKIRDNNYKDNEIIKYRKYKVNLYQKQRKLNRLKQKYDYLKYNISNKNYYFCFGSKKLFKTQYFLKDNGYKTHIKWLNDFRKNRDKIIESIGASEETQGNQMYQLFYNSDSDNFYMKLRKEKNYSSSDSKYLIIDNLNFKYMKDYLKTICLNNQNNKDKSPLSFRFIRRKNKWYLQIMFSIDCIEYLTRNNQGTLGLDFNDGFIEATETDLNGNILNQYHFDLKQHGFGNKAKSELQETISKIVNLALSKGKDIVIENLDFCKKKSKVTNNKKYNKMIHTLDYSKYIDYLQNACHRKQVGLIKVNPAYTSIIGEHKYGKQRKLNRHQSASYVIARLGQGYIDIFDKYSTIR